MKEHSIRMVAAEVRAILDGRKTQKRLVVKPHPEGEWAVPGKTSCPYGRPGDRLWVRETWACSGNEDGHPITSEGTLCEIEKAERFYRADAIGIEYGCLTFPDGSRFSGGWRPSIYMPRWASRITLEIVGVRVERLQEIKREDAIKEGVLNNRNDGLEYGTGPEWAFRELWNSINGSGSWSANPWVWVIEFKRVEV